MLEVYADEKILRKVDSLKKKKSGEYIHGRIFDFLNRSCLLYIDTDTSLNINNSPHYHTLTQFNQNKGDYGIIKPKPINTDTLENAKPWSVFLFSDENMLVEAVEKKYFHANKDNLIEKLQKLLFELPGQCRSFTVAKSSSGSNNFEGWKTLDGNNILELTDVVIVDPYFLIIPEHISLKSYISDCIIPLLQIFSKRCISSQMNVTVFAQGNKYSENNQNVPQDFLDELNGHPEFGSLNINFCLAVSNRLGIHQRYIFTNYQGMSPGLSLHGFTYDQVKGGRENFRISPYSTEPEQHVHDVQFLKELASKKVESFGDKVSNSLLKHSKNV